MKRWFILIVALQVLFIVGEGAMYAGQAGRGRTITLRVLPVDPRSLFMGNYMALVPAISRLDLNRLDFDAANTLVQKGSVIFVAVRPEPAGAVPVAASPSEGYTQRPDLVILRGTVTDVSGPAAHPTALHVDYGVNRFYFPEGREEEISRRMRRVNGTAPEITVTVSVPPSGRAIPRAMYIRGWKVPG